MWCTRCERQVAAIVGDSGDCTLCADCGCEIDVFADLATVRTSTFRAQASRVAESKREAILPHLSCSRARLDHIGRRLEALAVQTPAARRRVRVDETVAAAPAPAPSSLSSWVSGAGLFGGVTALVCGATLAGWSLVSDRAELWNIGLPTALLGQFLLLAALAAQSGFWRSSPPAAAGGKR